MKILIINGPNLNMLGQRQPDIYGKESFEETLLKLREIHSGVDIDYAQSNSEGEIIDFLQSAARNKTLSGIVINPGAYAHYSIAIADALAMLDIPVVEVHVSNIHAREEFRRKSVTASECMAVIAGCGRTGYSLAIEFILSTLREQQ
ncbi:MAG: type II 3-dehydroquinate dehydratase [Candidatus Amulumruptor caecigallinarius]|nr:type II 3-dehydroquinate dehydratase [Candidatus Amulumruptor caecigallinarius]